MRLLVYFYCFRPTGLRPSIGHSVCKSDGPAPPVFPVAFRASSALGVSALWLYVLDGTMFFKASLHGPKRGGLGLQDGF